MKYELHSRHAYVSIPALNTSALHRDPYTLFNGGFIGVISYLSGEMQLRILTALEFKFSYMGQQRLTKALLFATNPS